MIDKADLSKLFKPGPDCLPVDRLSEQIIEYFAAQGDDE